MTEEIEDTPDDPGLERLEHHHTSKVDANDVEDDTTYVEADAAVEDLEKAIDMLKRNAILFEYLTGDFVKSITKREQAVVARHVEQIYVLTDELEASIAELSEEEENE